MSESNRTKTRAANAPTPRQAHGAQEGGRRRQHRGGAGRARRAGGQYGQRQGQVVGGVRRRRARLGHGMKVAVIQFIKGVPIPARRRSSSRLAKRCRTASSGTSPAKASPGIRRNRARDGHRRRKAWDIARQYLADPAIGLVVLDDSPTSWKYGWLDIDRVLETLAMRPPCSTSSSPAAPPMRWSRPPTR